MKTEKQHKEATSRVLQQSKGGGGHIVDNRSQSTNHFEFINGHCSQLAMNKIDKSLIFERISNYRSSQVCQLTYGWSEGGADGVLIGSDERFVIKFNGYGAVAPELDRIATERFGLKTANARIINKRDFLWLEVKRALGDVNNKNKQGEVIDPQTALLMDKVGGRDLYDFSDNVHDIEKRKTACFDLGKILVMDLLTRNYDRFDLSGIKDRLGFSESDAEAHSSVHSSSDSSWNAWDGNGENMLIDENGNVIPIDSQFSLTKDEPTYVQNVAILLTDHINLLVESGMKILINSGWKKDKYQDDFKKGIETGIQCLMF